MEHHEEMAKMFEGVQGCVEATNYEYHSLWKDFSKQYYDTFKKTPDSITFDWISNPCGLGKEIGKIGHLPVCLSLRTAEIEEWLEKNLPSTAKLDNGIYLNKTDAQNFVNVIFNIRNRKNKN